MAVRGVLLDIDGTLLDTTSAMLHAGRVAFADLWPDTDEATLEGLSTRFRVDPGGHFARYTTGELSFAQMRQARLADVAEHLGRPLEAGAYDAFERAYRPAFGAAQRVFEDVEPFLAGCRAAGLVVGALTNSSAEATDQKLSVLRMWDRFEQVVTRDSLGFGKPDRRIFEHGCELLGTRAEQTAYVGDELVADALGARDAGLWSWWLRRPSPRAETDADGPDPAGVSVVTGLHEIDWGSPPPHLRCAPE